MALFEDETSYNFIRFGFNNLSHVRYAEMEIQMLIVVLEEINSFNVSKKNLEILFLREISWIIIRIIFKIFEKKNFRNLFLREISRIVPTIIFKIWDFEQDETHLTSNISESGEEYSTFNNTRGQNIRFRLILSALRVSLTRPTRFLLERRRTSRTGGRNKDVYVCVRVCVYVCVACMADRAFPN